MVVIDLDVVIYDVVYNCAVVSYFLVHSWLTKA